ncbi:MAG: pitrilysin family protein [Bacillota bacterium]|nr:pitrilysin family protein [Bacillota bacterium]
MKDIERIQIGNGIALNILRTQRFKTNVFTIGFQQELNREKASLNALLCRVLLQGSEKYPDMEALGNRLADLYGASLNPYNVKRGDIQEFGISASFIANKFALKNENVLSDTVDTMLEVLMNPLLIDGAFKNEFCETEKQNQISFIKAEIDNKVSYARNRCIELMCKDEVYGISEKGEIDTVRAIKPQELYKQYETLLEGANIEMYYVGSDDMSAVVDKLKTRFLMIERNVTAPLPRTALYVGGVLKEHVESMDVNQGKLTLGFRTGISRSDHKYPALTLMNSIFGLTPTSKLFLNVREKLSLCYYCRSDVIAQKGILLVSSGIETENKERALAEILLQLDNIKKGDVTENEIEVARKALISGIRSSFDNPAAMIHWYANEIISGTDSDPEDFIESLIQVKKEEVIRAAGDVMLDTVFFLKGSGKENS